MTPDYATLVRPEVASMKPYTPGTTVSQARKKYGLETFVKLSSNEHAAAKEILTRARAFSAAPRRDDLPLLPPR